MRKVAVMSTVKALPGEMSAFVQYHLGIGIDLMILFFDDPDDPVWQTLQGREKVVCIKNDESYRRKHSIPEGLPVHRRQTANAANGLEIAREKGCDWLVHIDVDEFLYAREPIAELLASAGTPVVRLTILEAVPRAGAEKHPYTELTEFKRVPRRWQLRLCRLFGCRRALFEGELFRAHTNSKVAFRVDADIESVGIHDVTLRNGTECVIHPEIKLLHFDSYSFEDWKRKWGLRSSLKDRSDNLRRAARHRQFRLYYDYRNDDEVLRRNYERLYRLPLYDRVILRMLGLLETIRLDRRLFRETDGPLCAPDGKRRPSV